MTLMDSDVVIAHLRGLPAATAWMEGARRVGGLAVSAVTITEVVGGMRSAERHEVRRLLASTRCEPIDREIADRAGELQRRYRRSHTGISTADYLVAATALVRELPLATLNVKDFPMVQGLRPAFDLPG